MSDIASVVGPGAGRLEPSIEASPRVASGRITPGRVERPSDRVELSDRARLLNKLSKLPAIRQDLVELVRQKIEDGVYDTPDHLDAAIEHLAEDLDVMG